MIYIGTSGFSYEDWKGYFYPRTIKKAEMLSFYAKHFRVCEVNSSYYRIPTSSSIESMLNKSQGKLKFVIKAHQSMTHQRNANSIVFRDFSAALRPMVNADCLSAVLLQFPYSFYNNLNNRGYLADVNKHIKEEMPVEILAEFRNKSWESPSVEEELNRIGMGIVNVDEPDIRGLIKPNVKVTGKIGYVRFHGRNKDKWYAKDAEPWERYNYLYSEKELQEWVRRIFMIAKKAEDTYVLFNNHWQSQAVTNAKQLKGLLGQYPGVL